jgi:hypothetical protein
VEGRATITTEISASAYLERMANVEPDVVVVDQVGWQ